MFSFQMKNLIILESKQCRSEKAIFMEKEKERTFGGQTLINFKDAFWDTISDAWKYASDFYEMILVDAKQLIFSGDKISDKGSTIWQHLLSNGHELFVYNTEDAFDKISVGSIEDLKKYLGPSTDFQKYRYVLSESVKEHSTVTTSFDLLETYLKQSVTVKFGIINTYR